MGSNVNNHRTCGHRRERSPSKKSIASVRNSSYVNSNTGHMFGEMLRVLKVRLSTNSYTLSNRSFESRQWECSGRFGHVPRTLFSRVFLMIGIMTSWT